MVTIVIAYWLILAAFVVFFLICAFEDINDDSTGFFAGCVTFLAVVGVIFQVLDTQRQTEVLIPRDQYKIMKADDYVIFSFSPGNQETSDKYRIVSDPEKVQLWRKTTYNHYDWNMGSEIVFKWK